jgi:hypothetical protein
MKNFREKIEQLNDIAYKNMGEISQLTIDKVQYMFTEEEPFGRQNYTKDELIAKAYDIDLILGIIDPLKVKDIEVLTELKNALEVEVENLQLNN